jgi:2-keto-4-pentenoate hydratase/2-oxohepta-3-ene-1,7-dioic acid hydratase in catechol pathway
MAKIKISDNDMKIVRYRRNGKASLGVVKNNYIVPIAKEEIGFPTDMGEFLELGEQGVEAAKIAFETEIDGLSMNDIQLLSPIARPGKFLAIGMNYQSHVAEVSKGSQVYKGMKTPENQIWFNKQTTCVNGPFDSIVKPDISDELDYEGELAVVIGKRCRNVSYDDALSVIAGYTVCNDVSVRDWQRLSKTMTMGKSWDTHGPLGPWMVTADEILNPQNLRIRTLVNGDVRQDFQTSEMVFNIRSQIEFLTTAFTLEPGDVIATGTSGGVGLFMKPQGFLKVDDIVEVEIEGIGTIKNKVVSRK